MNKQTIQQIKQQLRLAMNGVVSTSMREQGINYKLNFGVSIPTLHTIAARFTPDASLAESLWNEDIRETKILATLLHPIDQFTIETAERWAAQITHREQTDQLCMNLLRHHPQRKEMLQRFMMSSEKRNYDIGLTLLARLTMQSDLDQAELLALLPTLTNRPAATATTSLTLNALEKIAEHYPTLRPALLSASASLPPSLAKEIAELCTFLDEIK